MSSVNASQSKKILLGITGGIAAYKAAELVRLLVKQSYQVQVVMTEAACQFITPVTMQALSGNPVLRTLWDNNISNGMAHIDLSREADLVLIAPASADFIAKVAHGFADDLLSTLCLARNCPLMIAPAMNKQMWENPATQRNITTLVQDTIEILHPATGEQACGEFGTGRMQEPEDIFNAVTAFFTPKLFSNKNILITAGATIEMLDPVRGITNISSGKMGYAIAQTAAYMGANVTLVSGKTELVAPKGVRVISATSAETMYQTVMQHILHQDIFIGVAAVADYTPVNPSVHKVKKEASNLTIELKKNKDILAEVANLPNAPFCVGFAAETENLIANATQKRLAKKIPLIVANLVQTSMGQNQAEISLIDDSGVHTFAPADKLTLSNQILQHLHHLLSK
jgi:phosphopantothenoylcysteine decarboxylase/phosphopantothenate--cysteine ligase